MNLTVYNNGHFCVLIELEAKSRTFAVPHILFSIKLKSYNIEFTAKKSESDRNSRGSLFSVFAVFNSFGPYFKLFFTRKELKTRVFLIREPDPKKTGTCPPHLFLRPPVYNFLKKPGPEGSKKATMCLKVGAQKSMFLKAKTGF